MRSSINWSLVDWGIVYWVIEPVEITNHQLPNTPITPLYKFCSPYFTRFPNH